MIAQAIFIFLASFFACAHGFSHRSVSTLTKTNLAFNYNHAREKYRGCALEMTATSNSNDIVDKASKFCASTPYALLEAAVVFVLISSIDGGFSGDWSKYGLISKETEYLIQSSIVNVGFFHIFCSSIAAGVSKSRNQPVVPAVLHTMLIGGLGLLRVLLQTDETAVRFPSLSVYSVKQKLADIVAGDYDVVKVNGDIDKLLKENRCVMFSFTTCPFCIKAKKILIEDLGIDVKVVELDTDKKVGYPIRAELGRRTGRTSVPSVWIKGVFVGGCNDGPAVLANGIATSSGRGGIVAFNEEGLLRRMLK